MTQWAGVVPIEIQCGREGLWGIRNKNMIPIGGAIQLRNMTMEDHTWRSGGGAKKLGVPVPSAGKLGAGVDFWVDPVTQRTVVADDAGNIYKDDGTGNTWVAVASALTTGASVVPQLVLGGAEATGRNRKVFYCDFVNPVKVLNGDGGAGSMATIALPPADWAGNNQPGGLCVHQGYMWGFGNKNSPHTLYRSLQTNHEDLTTTPFSLNVFPGEGQYISAAVSFKGGMLVWKFPEFGYFIDTSDPTPTNWQVKRIGRAGCAGLGCATLLENDAIWVAPDASYHLASATYAIGSVHASDIAYRKLGQYLTGTINLGRLPWANLVYYSQKRAAHLASAAPGQNLKNRRIDLDLNREQDQGERWIYWDRDDNECIFMRRSGTTQTLLPVMGDNVGQVWLLDQINRDKNGQAYTCEFFLADTDCSQFVPQWAGKWKNLRYLQVEWDPRSTANMTFEIYRDGKMSQSLVVPLTAGGLVLPFTLPAVFGAETLQVSNKRQILGRARRFAVRGYITQTDADISISRLILGVEVGE